MRRLVVHLMAGALCLATALPPELARAQEPWQEETPSVTWKRDLTPYIVGLGAIFGVVAFNVAAPSVVGVGGSAIRSVRNIATVATVASGRVAAAAAGTAAPAVNAAATAAPAAAAAAAGPVVPPLTQSMLAQAQIGGIAAAVAGAAVVVYAYKLLNWTTGLAP